MMNSSDGRPRLLFVAHTAKLGGPAHSLLMLVKHLKQRFRIAVLLPEHGPLRELLVAAGASIFVIDGLEIGTIGRIWRLIRKERIDLVYGNNPSNRARNALIAAKLSRRPFIWHFRGVKNHWTRRQGFFMRWADEVVAVSKSCAESVQRFVPSREIRVVYNGVELPAFAGDRDAARERLIRELKLPVGARLLVSVAQLTPRKGVEQAVRAAVQVANSVPDTHLLIAGALDRDEEYTRKIRRLIRELGMEDQVHLLGFRSDLPRMLPGCEVLVHTAKQDPHPRAVVEAMAAGLPVIGFAVDGVAETVIEGETGYLLPAGDEAGMAAAICRILRFPDAGGMGRRGQERVRQHFTAAQTARRISEIIGGLLKQPPAASEPRTVHECSLP